MISADRLSRICYHDGMICQVEGQLVEVQPGRARIRSGDVTYELLIPASDEQRLHTQIGETIRFETLHYLEGLNQGASFIPRLIGFSSPDQRAFFELFTTVKGLGNRKALKALQLPCSDVARAIAEKDAKLLTSLPEIGKKLAETIIVELHGKVDRFIDESVPAGASSGDSRPQTALVRDALSVLVMLGEPRQQALQLLRRALDADPDIDSPDALISAAYRIKELV